LCNEIKKFDNLQSYGMSKRRKTKKGNLKLLISLVLAAIGFVIPLVVRFEGLSFAGHLALSIFLTAAIFWIFETIPIYATSLLIILLQVFLLSAQGPLFSRGELPTATANFVEDNQWIVPPDVLQENQLHIKTGPRTYETIDVEVLDRIQGLVVSDALTSESQIVSDSRSRFLGYTPVAFTTFIGTLANPVIILFLAGFMLAAGAVKYNLDKNITGLLLKPFGKKPSLIVLGLMFVTASLSAFMSNTATTAMMMTVALPIALQVGMKDKLRSLIILSIPIAANLGGLITPIGTPPNAIVISALQQQGIDINFGQWVGLMLPFALLMLLISWVGLQTLFPPTIKEFQLNLESRFNTSSKAITLYGFFGATVLLWVTEGLHGIPNGIVAFVPIAGLTLTSALTTEDIRKLPWEVLWLVAGGIALGLSMENTGLAAWFVSGVAWEQLPQLALLMVFGLLAYGFSVFLSNTVAATLLIPIAVSIAVSGVAGPYYNLGLAALVIGAACSLAMVLPISTPPNAIAMSTGLIKTSEMVRIGLLVGLIGLVATLLFSFLVWPMFLM